MCNHNQTTVQIALSECALSALRDLITKSRQPDLAVPDICDQIIFTARALKAYRAGTGGKDHVSIMRHLSASTMQRDKRILSAEDLLLCSTVVAKTPDEDSIERDDLVISIKLAEWIAATSLCPYG